MGDIGVTIRDERAGDEPGIRAAVDAAFGTREESRLVDALRAAGRARVSLVAVEKDRVVGHVLFSPVSVGPAPAGAEALGLAPLSVLPERQGRGIGSDLVREGLARCAEIGCPAVFVYGSPAYYARFGFGAASDHELSCVYPGPEHFQVAELSPGALAGCRGRVDYAPEFGAF